MDSSRKVLSPEAGGKAGDRCQCPPNAQERGASAPPPPAQERGPAGAPAGAGAEEGHSSFWASPAAAQAEGPPRHLPSSRTWRLPPVLPTGQPDRKPLVRGAWGPWFPNTEKQERLRETLRASKEMAQSIAVRGTVAVSHSASLEGKVWRAGLRCDTF